MNLKEPLYADTSALVKLIVDEMESDALAKFVNESELQLTSSEICEVELVRAVHRIDSSLESEAERLLEEMILLPMTSSVRARAAHIPPVHVRSLDAVHLASAMEIQASLNSFLSYDIAMNEAARSLGFEPISPS